MSDSDASPSDFPKILAVVGVGLIGGSIAAALKSRGFTGTIWGVGRNPDRLKAAIQAGLIDDFAERVEDVLADLWVFCTPVDRIAARVLSVHGQPGKTTLVTDAGSVKRAICEGVCGKLPAGVEFIGSHPLAGSEKRGFEHAEADLFVDRLCVLTPDSSTAKVQLERLREFWKFLGMQVVEMDAAAHDLALAETSHLPHLVAAALAGTLQEQNAHLAATGFADTTRIAAGDPGLWSAIFLENAEEISKALSRFSDRLREFQRALERKDAGALQNLLEHAKTNRNRL